MRRRSQLGPGLEFEVIEFQLVRQRNARQHPQLDPRRRAFQKRQIGAPPDLETTDLAVFAPKQQIEVDLQCVGDLPQGADGRIDLARFDLRKHRFRHAARRRQFILRPMPRQPFTLHIAAQLRQFRKFFSFHHRFSLILFNILIFVYFIE
ncbi:hypothetical protein SDC9_181261 [bioreactor metagenome]|uniref:Uncharacterized protein n=1 Tax=bioreactor metagenome TaxID=1076179 RepID=A0A645H6Q8_9ZZZZ